MSRTEHALKYFGRLRQWSDSGRRTMMSSSRDDRPSIIMIPNYLIAIRTIFFLCHFISEVSVKISGQISVLESNYTIYSYLFPHNYPAIYSLQLCEGMVRINRFFRTLKHYLSVNCSRLLSPVLKHLIPMSLSENLTLLPPLTFPIICLYISSGIYSIILDGLFCCLLAITVYGMYCAESHESLNSLLIVEKTLTPSYFFI